MQVTNIKIPGVAKHEALKSKLPKNDSLTSIIQYMIITKESLKSHTQNNITRNNMQRLIISTKNN